MVKISSSFKLNTKSLILGRLVLLLCIINPQAIIAREVTDQTEFAIGVNQLHLEWLSEDQQSVLLRAIEKSGFKRVRMSLIPPFDKSLHAIRKAQEAGLSVLAVVNISRSVFYPPEVKARNGLGQLNEARRLSDINLPYIGDVFDKLWNQIDDQLQPLAGIEIGNEINWSDFNGDFPVGQFTHEINIESDEKVIAGFKNYVALLRIVSKLRSGSRSQKNTLIISAGMASISPDFAQKVGGTFLPIYQANRMLFELGADKFVDGYGVHFYSGNAESEIEVVKQISDVTRFCAETHRSCWVTEWGVPVIKKSDSIEEGSRPNTINAVLACLSKLTKLQIIGGNFYFDFADSSSPYSLWRNNAITKSGEVFKNASRFRYEGCSKDILH